MRKRSLRWNQSIVKTLQLIYRILWRCDDGGGGGFHRLGGHKGIQRGREGMGEEGRDQDPINTGKTACWGRSKRGEF